MSEIENLKDLIKKNESRVTALGETVQGVLGSFLEESKRTIEEVDKVNSELEAADKRLAGYDDEISKLEEKKEGLTSETISLDKKNRDADKKLSALNSEMNSTTKELMKNQDILKQYLAKADATRKELENTEKGIADVQKETSDTKESNEKEILDTRTRFADAQRRIKDLSEREPLADFLLTEAASEPPEIGIVATLIRKNGLASMDDVKKSTKVPPAQAVKALNSLEQKGILERAGSNEVKLVKTY